MNKKILLTLGIIAIFASISTYTYKTVTAVKPVKYYINPQANFNSSKVTLMSYNQPTSQKVIFLTFDDGPSKRWTPRVLDILKENNVQATFFVVGTEIKKNPFLLRREIRDGHSIANHTYTHLFKKVYASPQNYINEIKKNDALLKSMGVYTDITRSPGGGKLNPGIEDWLSKNNFRSIKWDLAFDGFAVPHNAQFLLDSNQERFERKFKNRDQIIILMHDNIAGTDPHSHRYADIALTRDADVEALPQLIKFYKDQGYTFAVLAQSNPKPKEKVYAFK